MTLQEAAAKYPVIGLDKAKLERQEDAFKLCLEFFQGIEKSKRRYGFNSYSLKHMVENPSNYFDGESSQDCYNGYVYEGTLILAALVSSFTIRQRDGLTATFNIVEKSLRDRTIEFAKRRPATAE